MKEYQEGYQLTMPEIAAIVSLSGRQALVGFPVEENEQLTAQKLTDALCGMMRDKMLTQMDGKYLLCSDLAAVMRPVCQAGSILSLLPAEDLYGQILFYLGDTITAMENTPFGRYALWSLEPRQLGQVLMDHMALTYPEVVPDGEPQQAITVSPDSAQEQLLADARFLVERLNGTDGRREGWLRVTQQGMDSWIQWTRQGTLACEPLTPQALNMALQELM